MPKANRSFYLMVDVPLLSVSLWAALRSRRSATYSALDEWISGNECPISSTLACKPHDASAESPYKQKRVLASLRQKYFRTLPITLFLVLGTLAGAQTSQPPNLPGTISTVATPGFTLHIPNGVAVDQQNNLYISDTDDNRILKLNQQSGAVSVFAGTGTRGYGGDGGPATSAVLNGPQGITLDSAGNLYITESGNADVRKVTAGTGVITTIASGLSNPLSVAFDNSGQNLYIADFGSASIKEVGSGGTLTTVAVPGGLSKPTAVAFASGLLYIVDTTAGVVETFNVTSQAVTQVATGLSKPWGVTLDATNNVYVSEYGDASLPTGGQVIMINASNGSKTIIAGNGQFASPGPPVDGGPAPNAEFEDHVTGIAIGPDGNLYIDEGVIGSSDSGGQVGVIRKVSFPASSITAPLETVPGCTVISFSAGPNPIYTNAPFGITSLLANVTCAYEIHVGSPSGPLFATGNGYTSTLTGPWVSDGMQFYLQQAGNTTSQGTLALPLTVHINAGQPGLACVVTAFTASPNPIITTNQYGQTTITAVTNCSFDIRIGSPGGPEFKEGRGYAALQTGQWVTNGMVMYLQPHGDTNASDTLATLKLVMQAPPSGCTVNDFSSPNNPIQTHARLNQIVIHIDATCAYDVRVGSPSGGLLGSGSGADSFTTGTWATNGISFFLQKAGDSTAPGTLATFTVNTKLPDQVVPSCTIRHFKATPLDGASGQTTINVNAACPWDLRENDSAGTLITSGTGEGSAIATNVTNGTKFYLQPHNDTNYADNLAVLSVTPASPTSGQCAALVFTATPVQSDNAFGYSTISADATCPYDIRIGSPDGGLFGSGTGFTSANTGDWVLFGQQFFLQKAGDTTSAGTLASQSAIVLP